MSGLAGFVAMPLMPYIAGGLLAVAVGGGWYLHHSGYESGKADADKTWQANADKQAAALATVTAQRDAAVRGADVAAADARRAVDALAARGRDTVKEYYRANPAANLPCLTAVRLRAIADANAAAMAAASAPR